MDGSILKKLGILIDLGRIHNLNKNPVAENAIKEFHKERLRLNPAGGRISEIERSIITKNMNSRIRERGLTSKEMAFNRDQITNEVKICDDKTISKKQIENRLKRHPTNQDGTKTIFNVGDSVFLKSGKSKLRAREAYKVVKLFQINEEKWATIQKCETKFMSKEYDVKFSEIFKVPDNLTLSESDLEEDAINNEIPCEHLSPIDIKVPDGAEMKSKPESLSEKKLEDPVIDKALNSHIEKKPIRDRDDIDPNQNGFRRPKRKAALKFQSKMKEILPSLKIKTKFKDPIKQGHGWKYEDWLKEIDDDPYDVITNQITFNTNDPVDSSEDTLNSPEYKAEESEPSIPFGQLLRNLDDISYQPERTNHEFSPMGMLGMFPPNEEPYGEVEEMTWDNSTTPPALRELTNEDIDDQLNSVLVQNELYPDESVVIDDLTSENSDDVFFDESILEVTIDGKRKFS